MEDYYCWSNSKDKQHFNLPQGPVYLEMLVEILFSTAISVVILLKLFINEVQQYSLPHVAILLRHEHLFVLIQFAF